MSVVVPRVSVTMPALQNHVHVFSVAPARDNGTASAAQPGRVRPFNNRKAHTKSRAGCEACKRRRIKCDEAKPDCGYCTGRGVACAYPAAPAPRAARSEPPPAQRAPPTAVIRREETQALISQAPSARPSAVTAIQAHLKAQERALLERKTTRAGGGGAAAAPFTEHDLELMAHFQYMTLFTLGGENHMMGGPFERELPRHAMDHPFLLHAVLAVAAAHRRTLEDWALRPTASEVQRHQRALYTFGRRMARPLRRDDAEAMLVTAGMLNAMDMAAIDTTDPTRAWPNTARPDALGWIAVGGGPKTIVDAAMPWIEAAHADAPDHARRLHDDVASMRREPPLRAIPAGLAALCDVDVDPAAPAAPDPATHPYLTALLDVAPVLNRPDGAPFVLLRDSKFLGGMRPGFLQRLRDKDVRALVVLARWYGKLCTFPLPWWMTKRVTIECKAICLYLRDHPDPRVRAEMRHPAAECGYAPPAAFTGRARSVEVVDEDFSPYGAAASSEEHEWGAFAAAPGDPVDRVRLPAAPLADAGGARAPQYLHPPQPVSGAGAPNIEHSSRHDPTAVGRPPAPTVLHESSPHPGVTHLQPRHQPLPPDAPSAASPAAPTVDPGPPRDSSHAAAAAPDPPPATGLRPSAAPLSQVLNVRSPEPHPFAPSQPPTAGLPPLSASGAPRAFNASVTPPAAASVLRDSASPFSAVSAQSHLPHLDPTHLPPGLSRPHLA